MAKKRNGINETRVIRYVALSGCLTMAFASGSWYQSQKLESRLNLNDFSNVQLTSASVERAPAGFEQPANQIISTYQFWSDDMLIQAYDTYWHELQDAKIRNAGQPLSGEERDEYQVRFASLWRVMVERGISAHTIAPEHHMVEKYITSDTVSFLQQLD